MADAVIKITGDASGFESAVTKAKGGLASLQSAATAVTGAYGRLAAIAGTALAALNVKSAIDAADHLNDLSKSTGVAVGTLGGLGFAATQAGSDLDSAAKAFGKLNLSVAKAAAFPQS